MTNIHIHSPSPAFRIPYSSLNSHNIGAAILGRHVCLLLNCNKFHADVLRIFLRVEMRPPNQIPGHYFCRSLPTPVTHTHLLVDETELGRMNSRILWKQDRYFSSSRAFSIFTEESSEKVAIRDSYLHRLSFQLFIFLLTHSSESLWFNQCFNNRNSLRILLILFHHYAFQFPK